MSRGAERGPVRHLPRPTTLGGWLHRERFTLARRAVQFTVLLGFMIAPIVQMSNIGSQFTEAFAGLDRTEEIMNMDPEDDPEERPIMLDRVHGNFRFENVSFAYEEGKPVVHEVSFEAPAGSVTALVGTSGNHTPADSGSQSDCWTGHNSIHRAAVVRN